MTTARGLRSGKQSVRDFSNQKKSSQLQQIAIQLRKVVRQYQRMRMLERKEDTRRKIQLGGLVKKAKLDNEPTAVILGLLVEAAELLRSDSKEGSEARSRWRLKGDLHFIQTDKSNRSS